MTTVLALTAHPDDAEWFAGGTLARLAAHRSQVIFLAEDALRQARRAGLDVAALAEGALDDPIMAGETTL